MNWLESLIYGLISGVSEFLPISSSGHQQILLSLFGINERDPVRDLFTHLAMLLAIVISNKSLIDLVKRERSVSRKNRNSVRQNMRALLDWRLVRNSVLPLLITMFLLRFIISPSNSLLITVIFFAINGFILYLPNRMMQGNKDARSMTGLDSTLLGCSGAISIFPGISRLGCTYSVAVIRGADRKHAVSWSLILSIYALAIICVLDLFSIFSTGAPGFWGNLFTYILSGITAYLGSNLSISAIRFLVVRPSNNGFAYYSWGASLFTFILYLTIC